jgi:hypothetical protein
MRDNRFVIKAAPRQFEDTIITYNEKAKDFDLGEYTSKEWLEAWTNIDIEVIEKIRLEQLIGIDLIEIAAAHHAKVTQIFMQLTVCFTVIALEKSSSS